MIEQSKFPARPFLSIIIGVITLLLPLWVGAASNLTELSRKAIAKEFSLPDLDGNVHNLSSYRGKVVLINFWATWCPPCRQEMPSMQRVWEKFRDRGFVILALDVGEDDETILPFVMEHDLDFPVLLDQDSKVVKKWPVRGLPTSFLLDTKGRLVYRAIGGREWDDSAFEKIILKLLEEK
jgi:peroxiredoxin